MAQLIWAPSALKDIDLIARYISKDSVQAAENIVSLFFQKQPFLKLIQDMGNLYLK